MKVQPILYFNLKALYHKGRVLAYIVLFFLINTSCIKQLNLYEGDKDEDNGNSEVKEKAVVCETDFFYPFDKEVKSIETTLTIRTRTPLPEDISRLKTEIPPLKYNKSWLFMLTQDDASKRLSAVRGQQSMDTPCQICIFMIWLIYKPVTFHPIPIT